MKQPDAGAGVRMGTLVNDVDKALPTSAAGDSNMVSATFVKPTDWDEYEIVVWADLSIRGTGVGQTVSSRIDIGGDIGATQADGFGDPYRVLHPENDRQGITGDVTLNVRAWADTQGSKTNARLHWFARRTA